MMFNKSFILFIISIFFWCTLSGQNCDKTGANSGLELDNFTHWEGKSGDVACSFFRRKIRNINNGFFTKSQKIVTVGQDCDVPEINIVYEGNHALMLGDKHRNDREKASFATYNFEVTDNNKDFYFYYSLILQNPDHSNCKKPYFKYRIFTPSTEIKEFEIVADSSNPFFKNARGECDIDDLVYSNWNCERTDLSSYLGECVKIEFLVTDCTEGGHWGVAYIDALGVSPNTKLISEFSLNKSNIGYCFDEPIIIDGSLSENESSHFISIEESDANMGRPNPISEKSKWFIGEKAGKKNITELFKELGGVWKCNNYYRIKLAVAASCGGWVEKTKLVKISCPQVDAGNDICCQNISKIGTSNNQSSYTYQWNPQSGIVFPNNFLTTIHCDKLTEFDLRSVLKYRPLQGDFNGDEKMDIAFIGDSWSGQGTGMHILTLFSNGDGTYSFEQFVAGDGSHIYAHPPLTGDFNGDGKTDIAFIGDSWSGQGTGMHIRTRFSNGDGTYSFEQFVAGDGSLIYAHPALTGDFNGDGKTDIAFIGDSWSGQGTGMHIRTRFSNGDGTYNLKQFVAGDGSLIYAHPPLTGDFNGDGKTDIAFIGDSWSGQGTGMHIRTRFSNGDGTYNLKQFVAGDGSLIYAHPPLTGDFNGDGKTDVTFVGKDWSGPSSGLHIRTRMSNGNGTYRYKQFILSGGKIILTLTATDQYGCIVSDNIQVFKDKPIVKLTSRKEGCCAQKIIFQSSNTTSYVWSTGESDVTSIDVLQPGEYSVTATNLCGTTVEKINISGLHLSEFRKDFPKIIHPTAFTPNGDGKNEVFRLLHYANDGPVEGKGPAYNATKYNFYVFDRWGEVMYKKEGETCTGFINGEIEWNGKNSTGKLQSEGVYNWRLELFNCKFNYLKKLTLVTSEKSFECVDCRFGLTSTCGFLKTCYKYEEGEVIYSETVGHTGSVRLILNL